MYTRGVSSHHVDERFPSSFKNVFLVGDCSGACRITVFSSSSIIFALTLWFGSRQTSSSTAQSLLKISMMASTRVATVDSLYIDSVSVVFFDFMIEHVRRRAGSTSASHSSSHLAFERLTGNAVFVSQSVQKLKAQSSSSDFFATTISRTLVKTTHPPSTHPCAEFSRAAISCIVSKQPPMLISSQHTLSGSSLWTPPTAAICDMTPCASVTYFATLF